MTDTAFFCIRQAVYGYVIVNAVYMVGRVTRTKEDDRTSTLG